MKQVNLDGLLGRRVAVYNGGKWSGFDYQCVGYSVDTDDNGREMPTLYLICPNGAIIERIVENLKIQ